MEKIIMIDIDKIHAHPDNPRKDVGDVTELAESIKEQGIMQNLTVVPYFSKVHNRVMNGLYTVIIGHRRLAAAKKAGLTAVPCAVVELSEKEQLATMLSENMQRVDLTPIEETLGVQMLLDLGDSVKDISKLTGFSESKVRQRVKMSKLPREAFEKSSGGSIQDYIKITEIENEKTREKLLKSLGTNDFNLEYNRALAEQKHAEKLEKWEKLFKSFAVKLDGKSTLDKKYEGYIYISDRKAEEYKIPSDVAEVQYYYELSSWGVRLYKDYSDEEKKERAVRDMEKDKRNQEREACIRHLTDLKDEFARLRKSFASEYSGQKEHMSEMLKFFIEYCFNGNCDSYNSRLSEGTFQELLGENGNVVGFRQTRKYKSLIAEQPLRVLLSFIVAFNENNMHNSWNYEGEFSPDESTDEYIALLEKVGYEPAEEERRFYSGTHEAYYRRDK